MSPPALSKCAMLIGFSLVAAAPRTAGAVDWDDPVRIGGWVGSPGTTVTTARGGTRASLQDSVYITKLRNRVLAEFPSAILSGTQTLTPEYLATIDVLWISSWHSGSGTGVPALSPAEQSAIRGFVDDGGTVMLFGETPLTSGGLAGSHLQTARSFFLAFDMTLRDHPAWPTGEPAVQRVKMASEMLRPPTAGPFDVRLQDTDICQNSFLTKFTGAILDAPGYVELIGHLSSNLVPVVAFIPCDALGPASGAVLAVSDSSMLQDDGNGLGEDAGHVPVQNMILNMIAYHGACARPVGERPQPEPQCIEGCPLEPSADDAPAIGTVTTSVGTLADDVLLLPYGTTSLTVFAALSDVDGISVAESNGVSMSRDSGDETSGTWSASITVDASTGAIVIRASDGCNTLTTHTIQVEFDPPPWCAEPILQQCKGDQPGSVFHIELIGPDDRACRLPCTVAAPGASVTCNPAAIACD